MAILPKPKPMTEQELKNLTNFPEVHKKAIEHAIWESTGPDDPEDKVWPDYFRAEEVACQLGCKISEDDKLAENEYEGDCVWFQSGWKAAVNALKALEKAKQIDLGFMCGGCGTIEASGPNGSLPEGWAQSKPRGRSKSWHWLCSKCQSK